jgi:CheY-like chemotaxis protein
MEAFGQMSHKIMVVDDDVDFLTQMSMWLESTGYEAVTVESAQTARMQLDEVRPDAVLVDLMMETPDAGFALCYHIKRTQPSLPVIMVTAVSSATGITFDAETDEERAWIKADALLTKPVRFEQLEAELERLLKD